MKTSVLLFLLWSTSLHPLFAQCQIITLPYGQVQIDINRGYKIIPTPDSNFVIAGEWNNEAFLLKVDAQGQQLALKKYGNAITGQSSFLDIVATPDGGFVAVGECIYCVVPDDSLRKVVAIKTDADLNLDAAIGVKKFGTVTLPGGFVTNGEQHAPLLVRTGDTYLLASSVTLGLGLNWEDVCLTRLSDALAPLWVKSYHTGYFEAPGGFAATNDGFILPVNRAFTTQATLLKINQNGDFVWLKTFEADAVRGIVYLPSTDDVVVVGGRNTPDQAKQAMLLQFDADSGIARDSLFLGDDQGDEGYDVKPLANGGLLVGVVSNQTNPFGLYATSRIYRVKTDTLQADCYYLVPNPDNITNMGVRSILPLSENGKDFAVAGIRGFSNRTFFHTRQDCETTRVNAEICPGDTYTLPDGTMVTLAGIYNTTLAASDGCDSIVQTTVGVFPPIPPVGVTATICPGDTYTLPDGTIVQAAGAYNTTLAGANGCDSIVQTTLGFYAPIPPGSVEVALCPGETHTLPNGLVVSAPGAYTATLTASNGCDSIIHTTVTLLTAPVLVTNVELCPGETYTLENGQTVSTAGVYDAVYSASNGCDSLVRTIVAVLDTPATIVLDVVLCEGVYYLLPNGDSTATPGDYAFPYTATNGCEGIQIIGISTFPPIQVDGVDIHNDNGQGSGSIGLGIVSGGAGTGYQYAWSNGANTPDIGNLSQGIYALTITDAAGCSETFAYTIGTTGLEDPSSGCLLRLFPNPFSDQIKVDFDVTGPVQNRFEMHLVDVWGQRRQSIILVPGAGQVLHTVDLPAGVYFVQVLTDEKFVLGTRVLKQ